MSHGSAKLSESVDGFCQRLTLEKAQSFSFSKRAVCILFADCIELLIVVQYVCFHVPYTKLNHMFR